MPETTDSERAERKATLYALKLICDFGLCSFIFSMCRLYHFIFIKQVFFSQIISSSRYLTHVHFSPYLLIPAMSKLTILAPSFRRTFITAGTLLTPNSVNPSVLVIPLLSCIYNNTLSFCSIYLSSGSGWAGITPPALLFIQYAPNTPS